MNRLKWMLEQTLGSPDAFRYRREELAMQGKAVVTEEDVLRSFRESLQPQGLVARYLREGQLALRIQDTLFVHGAVEEEALGFVPSQLTQYKRNSGWAGEEKGLKSMRSRRAAKVAGRQGLRAAGRVDCGPEPLCSEGGGGLDGGPGVARWPAEG